MYNAMWTYNHGCFNQQAYTQIQAQMYEQSQQRELAKAIRACQDLFDSVKKLDPRYRELLGSYCFAEIINRQ